MWRSVLRALLLCLACAPAAAQSSFVRGNCNGDGIVNVADAVYLINLLFLSGPEPVCDSACDANDDGTLTLADAVYIVTYRFLEGPTPSAPFPECGVDSTPDALSCEGPSSTCSTMVGLALLSPLDGAIVNDNEPQLSVDFDGGAAFVLSSFQATLDGVSLSTSGWIVIASGAAGTLPPLNDGQHMIEVQVADLQGAVFTDQSTFTVSTGGGATRLVGRLLDPTDDSPIVGAEVFVEQEPGTLVVTDAEGFYEVSPMLSGSQAALHLVFDPTALAMTDSGGVAFSYPLYKRPVVALAGATVSQPPVFLPRIYSSVATSSIDPAVFDCGQSLFLQDFEIESPEADVVLTIPAGTYVAFPPGTDPCSAYFAIAPVDVDNPPSNLPPGIDPAQLITIQPTGMEFFEGIGGPRRLLPISFANMDGIPPGNDLDLYSVDHETGEFLKTGVMEADPGDPTRLVTTSGGISGGSWHSPNPPALTPEPLESDLAGGSCNGSRFESVQMNPEVSLESGTVIERFALPRRELFDALWGLDLVYNSASLVDTAIGRLDLEIPLRSAVPNAISVNATIAGVPLGDAAWFDPSAFPESDTSQLSLPYAFPLDGLATGIYPYVAEVENHYAQSGATSFLAGHFPVLRQPDGPFGRGWGLDLDDRLYTGANDGLLVVEGFTSMQVFQPVYAAPPAMVEPEAVYQDDVPEDVSFGGIQADQILVFPEKVGFDLPVGITVNATEPGLYDQLSDLDDVDLAEGTRVNCYFVHQDTPGTGLFTNTGTATFSTPIIGVIARLGDLTATDAVLGVPGTIYNNIAREVEFPDDRFSISADRRTLTIRYVTGTAVDHLRVVTVGTEAEANQWKGPPGDFSVVRHDDATGDWWREYPEGSTDRFDPDGRLTDRRHVSGRTTSVGRDPASGDILSVTDPAGGVTAFTYSGGRVTSIEDPAGRVTQLAYTGGDLTQITDAVQTDWSYSYDVNGLMTGSLSDLGVPSVHSYDELGRLVRTTYPDGTRRELRSVTSFFIDQLAIPSSESFPYSAQALAGVQATLLDETEDGTADPKLVQGLLSTFAAGEPGTFVKRRVTEDTVRIVATVRHPQSNLVTRVSVYEGPDDDSIPLVSEQELSWDHARGILLESRQKGLLPGEEDRFSTFEWDAERNWLLASNVAVGTPHEIRSESARDPVTGLVTAITRQLPGGATATTSFAYDADTALTEVTLPTGNTATYCIDPVTKSSCGVTAAGQTYGYPREATGFVSQTIWPDGVTAVSYTRDALGRVREILNPDGGVQETFYDPFGQVTAVRDASTVPGPLMPMHTFAYDARGRLELWTSPLGEQTSYAYREDGLLLETLDARGIVTGYLYEPLSDRLSEVQYRAFAGQEPPADAIGYSYGPLDRVLALSAANGSEVSYGYNSFSEVTAEEQLSPGGESVTLIYARNALGLADTQTLFVGAGLPVVTESYDYDSGFLVGLDSTLSGSFGVTYDPQLGRVTSVARGRDIATTYGYDPLTERLERVETTRLGVTTALDELTFDANNNLATQTLQRALLAPSRETRSFSYDANLRLETESGALPGLTQSYGPYDEVGNRRTGTHLYDDGDRLLSDGVYTYQYDPRGNLIERSGPGGTRSYGYDARGFLTVVEENGSPIASFAYDPLGRRVEVEAGGTVRRTVFSGFDELATTDGTGDVQAVATFGPGLDEVWAVTQLGPTPETLYTVLDWQGSVTQLIDATGVRSEYLYDAFGNLADAAGPDALGADMSFGYVGRSWNADTELYYMRARYYAPEQGRFVSREPLLLGAVLGYVPSSTNPYQYALNDPLMLNDTTGLFPEESDVDAFVLDYLEPVFSEYGLDDIGVVELTCKTTLLVAGGAIIGSSKVVIGIAGTIGRSLAGRGGAQQLSREAQRGIRSLGKRIAEHEKKLADFKANPTPRPGTEGLSKEIQQQSIDGRIRHLEREIETFRRDIERLRGGGQ